MRVKSKRYRRHMGKAEDALWHALAVVVLCLVVFVRGCAKAVQMG